MTDFRALCAELRHFVAEYQQMRGLDPENIYSIHQGIPEKEAHLRVSQLTLAADLLDQQPVSTPYKLPEAVAPTDEEIEEWADAATEVPLEKMDPEVHGWRRCFTAKEFGETIRAALSRWSTPANNTRGTH